MMDRNTAEELGFEIEVVTRQRHFGSFYGPGGKVIYYYGQVKGPIQVWVDKEVQLDSPEFKIVDHCKALVLLGNDVLK